MDAPLAKGFRTKNLPARSRSGRTPGSIILTKSEYLKDIKAPGNFTGYDVSSLQINPGLIETAPWASTLAGGYQHYRFNKLRFSLMPTVGADTPGMWGVAVLYDSQLPLPTTKLDFLDTEGAARASAWMPCEYDAPLKDLRRADQFFVRLAEDLGDLDPNVYDLGKVIVTTDGYDLSTATAIGELWITYEIEFYTPTRRINQGARFGYSQSTGVSPVAGPLANSNFVGSTLPMQVYGDNAIIFPEPGQYVVSTQGLGNTTALTGTSPFVAADGLSIYPLFGGGTQGPVSISNLLFDVLEEGASAIMSFAGNFSGGSSILDLICNVAPAALSLLLLEADEKRAARGLPRMHTKLDLPSIKDYNASQSTTTTATSSPVVGPMESTKQLVDSVLLSQEEKKSGRWHKL
jgi:hypothetical protein